MFSFKSRRAHSTRRRIYAMNYSKSSISKPNIQHIIKRRSSSLIRFIAQQTSSTGRPNGKSSPLVVRNLFRALQADIITAFVLSESIGTNFLGNLTVGRANTAEQLGMTVTDLFHDDKRDAYFFWESESPFKSLAHLLGWDCPIAHANAETWVSHLISAYEGKAQALLQGSNPENKPPRAEGSVYGKMMAWSHPDTGRRLSWDERASEIMDHIGLSSQSVIPFSLHYLTGALIEAGQDPVPAVLEYITRRISLHPDIQDRLHQEVVSSLPSSNEDWTFAMVDALPFLNALVLEGLRLVDTIESYQRRVVPAGGCMIEGFHLPAGVSMLSDLGAHIHTP